MKEYATEKIRNIALIGHGSAGKTTLTEAFLHFTGATTRLGKIEDGTTVSDFEDEEIRRKISLSTSVIPIEFQDLKINLLDTPGFPDFVGEVISALRVCDGAMVLRGFGGRSGSGHRNHLAALRGVPPAALRGHRQDGPRERQLRAGAGEREDPPGRETRSGAVAHRPGRNTSKASSI